MEDARTVGASVGAVAGRAAAVRRAQLRRQVRRFLTRGAIALVIFVCVGRLVQQAILDKAQFVSVTLNGLTFAGLLFISASGLTLIFGLLRVINMAHGALFLLGGYVALEHPGPGRYVAGGWPQPAGDSGASRVAALGLVGLVMHQLLLRWNQGQDLRQALITIAVALILADQMLAHFGAPRGHRAAGLELARPAPVGVTYPTFRLAMLVAALIVGLLFWLVATDPGRHGGPRRRRRPQMTSRLGVNVQRVFAAAFFVGSALAGLGGVFAGTALSLAPGQDQAFLVSALVVVIVGGMGSLGGAALGALLLGLVDQYSSASTCRPQYSNLSVLLTFVLLAVSSRCGRPDSSGRHG